MTVLEQNITNTIITEDEEAANNNDNENEDARSTVSTASSSPFELCEVTDIAIIESNSPATLSRKLSEGKNDVVGQVLNERQDNQKAFISNNDKHSDEDTKTGMHISLLKPSIEASDVGNLEKKSMYLLVMDRVFKSFLSQKPDFRDIGNLV